MQASSSAKKERFFERRHCTLEQAILWERLSLSQKFAASSLYKFGYELAFIGNQKNNASLAVLLCGDSVATISIEGDINSNPDIVIR
ncbi:MAG: hypothetical protein QMC51_11420 [Alteromonadaceae bacterium]